ncbi:hypothetical protein UFOVP942_40 [uncultured Caudovirales phage]|uniref:Uncharacterized protein n=1 Tax=uncultured Caudovirales phage TaxID=2100421 RepID=A0A6J5S4D2_9CAUD|nr:hypothetical protein UFOVP942_40 [uncultured Caudovirales phage]CAB4203358.1 hypothetical protein UFOVP1379_41 [uncultured Caudovirales phage]
MTLDNSTQKVSLSWKDWIGFGGIAVSILSAVLGVFLHHDRLLVQLVTQQETTINRLDKIEARLDRNNQ